MKSALLKKRAFTGFPNEKELLEAGGDRLFEADSLRQPGQRMLVAVAEDGSIDYPVYDPDKKKVKWNTEDRFGKKFKSEVKKHMQAEVEKAETPKEEEEATNDPALRKAAAKKRYAEEYPQKTAAMKSCVACECGECYAHPRIAAKKIASSLACPYCETTEVSCPNCGNRETITSGMLGTCMNLRCKGQDTLKECIGCGRSVTPDGKAIIGPQFRKQPFIRTAKTAASVHDIKPLIMSLKGKKGEEAIELTEGLIGLCKAIGAAPLRIAAIHYRDKLFRTEERQSVGIVPRRTQRALEEAWAKLQAAYVHYVR